MCMQVFIKMFTARDAEWSLIQSQHLLYDSCLSEKILESLTSQNPPLSHHQLRERPTHTNNNICQQLLTRRASEKLDMLAGVLIGLWRNPSWTIRLISSISLQYSLKLTSHPHTHIHGRPHPHNHSHIYPCTSTSTHIYGWPHPPPNTHTHLYISHTLT